MTNALTCRQQSGVCRRRLLYRATGGPRHNKLACPVTVDLQFLIIARVISKLARECTFQALDSVVNDELRYADSRTRRLMLTGNCSFMVFCLGKLMKHMLEIMPMQLRSVISRRKWYHQVVKIVHLKDEVGCERFSSPIKKFSYYFH